MERTLIIFINLSPDRIDNSAFLIFYFYYMALIYSVCRCFNKPVLHRVNIYKIFAIKVSSFTESYRILDKDFANELAAGNINMKSRGRENNFPLLKMV